MKELPLPFLITIPNSLVKPLKILNHNSSIHPGLCIGAPLYVKGLYLNVFEAARCERLIDNPYRYAVTASRVAGMVEG